MKALLAKLPFFKKKGEPDEEEDLEDGASDDAPEPEPPLPKVPRFPLSRRTWGSKSLIITLFLLPFMLAAAYFVFLTDSAAAWAILTRDTPSVQAVIPGNEREVQEEITARVLSVEERRRLEEQAAAEAADTGQSPEEIAARLEAEAAQQIAEEAQQAAEAGEELSPEQLAALALGTAEEEEEEKTRQPLRPVPQPGLQEAGSFGPVPTIAADGREPWSEYSRPFDPGNFDQYIGLVMVELGLNQANTEQAILTLPRNVTLAFSPYAPNLRDWMQMARDYGHEVMVGLPMEPDNFPLSDPGPRALMTNLEEGENLVRMEWILSRFPGFVGVVSTMGSKFAASDDNIRPIITMMKQRGLMYLDAEETQRSLGGQLSANFEVPNAVSNLVVDTQIGRRQIDEALRTLERLALRNDLAIGIARPYPVTIQRVDRWAKTLARRELTLAPVTALVNQQLSPQIDAGALAREETCEEGDTECEERLAAEAEADE